MTQIWTTKTALALALVASVLFALPSDAKEAIFTATFDSPGLAELPPGMTINTQFAQPDQVPGVAGQAWRTDGFSSWASLPIQLQGVDGFTFSTWLALESFPSDLEVPVTRLSPSSIAHQRDGSRGFDLFIDTYGRWGLWIATDNQKLTVDAPDRLPLYEWVHIVATVDSASRSVTLYIDGDAVASATLKKNSRVEFSDSDLELARSHTEVGFLNFTFNRLNAAYDDVAIYDRALSASEVRELRAAYGEQVPDAKASLIVPESRFAGDHHRPRFHAMPPANWTNEPHGMVRKGDTWHLFYQRTPNGPFKTQMHWGHMASDDLVTWRHLPDALRPELQDDNFGFDQKGIWSGDIILDGDAAFAFYTSVNHSNRLSAFNPGVAMAVSEDPELRNWRKIGPIINTQHVNDFRDPYLWREDGTWHMLIGAALESGGGLDYYVLEATEKGGRWTHRPRFSAISYRILDIGSIIWEMPVFEKLTDDVRILLVNPIGGEVTKYGDPATRAIYWIGKWRDGLFHPLDREPRMLDIIPGHLAPTVARGRDGQLRAIGIVDERRTPQSQEDAGWAHTFTLPRIWRLLPDGLTLGQAPAPELAALRGARILSVEGPLISTSPAPLFEATHGYELQIDLDTPTTDGRVILDILVSPERDEFTRLIFDAGRGEVVLDKSRSTLSTDREGPDTVSGSYDASAFGAMKSIRVFVDGSVVDVFINDAAAFAFRSYPTMSESTGVHLSSPDALGLSRVTAWALGRHQSAPIAAPNDQQYLTPNR
jgi:sucrose-6-phosphate hydrolase SacC (GH32 family)